MRRTSRRRLASQGYSNVGADLTGVLRGERVDNSTPGLANLGRFNVGSANLTAVQTGSANLGRFKRPGFENGIGNARTSAAQTSATLTSGSQTPVRANRRLSTTSVSAAPAKLQHRCNSTGIHNIGFGNTGNNNIGIGLSGDNQIRFGPLNASIANMGLFSLGDNNFGMANAG